MVRHDYSVLKFTWGTQPVCWKGLSLILLFILCVEILVAAVSFNKWPWCRACINNIKGSKLHPLVLKKEERMAQNKKINKYNAQTSYLRLLSYRCSRLQCLPYGDSIEGKNGYDEGYGPKRVRLCFLCTPSALVKSAHLDAWVAGFYFFFPLMHGTDSCNRRLQVELVWICGWQII